MKTYYIGEHLAIEFDKTFFALGIIIGWGAFCIDLGHMTIKVY